MNLLPEVIPALCFVEDCLKIVAPTESLFYKTRTYYRKNKICVESFSSSREDTSENIISLAYEYFRFGCHQPTTSFYKEYEQHQMKIEDNLFVKKSIIDLFQDKGLVNGQSIYLSSNVKEILAGKSNDLNLILSTNDSYMMQCYQKLVGLILNKFNVIKVPPLKEATLITFVDELFPPKEYCKSGFSSRKKEALLSLFNKEKAA